jgi:hypothetical protein
VAIGVGVEVGESEILSKIVNTAPPVLRFIGFTTFTTAAVLTNVVLSPYYIEAGQTDLMVPVNQLANFTIGWWQSGNTESDIVLAPASDDGNTVITYPRGLVPSITVNQYIEYGAGTSYRLILGGWGGQSCCGRFGDKCMATCPNGVGEPYDVTDCNPTGGAQPGHPAQCANPTDPSWSNNPCSPFMSGPTLDSAGQLVWVQYRRGLVTVSLEAGLGTPPAVDGKCVAPSCQSLCTRDVDEVGSPNSASVSSAMPPSQFYTSNSNFALNEIAISAVGLFAYQSTLTIRGLVISYP